MSTPEPQGAWDRSIDQRIAKAFRLLGQKAGSKGLAGAVQVLEDAAHTLSHLRDVERTEKETAKVELPEPPLGPGDWVQVLRW